MPIICPGLQPVVNDGRTANYRLIPLIIIAKSLIFYFGMLHNPDDADSKGDYGETSYQISG